MATGVHLTVEQQDLQRVVASIKAEADGKALRRELNRELKAIAQPSAEEAKRAILAMPSQDARFGDLRQSIAQATKVSVTAVGRNTGVSIFAAPGKYPREFKQAPRRFDAKKFRHRVFGRDQWVDQVGSPGWFDKVKEHKAEYAKAIGKALEEMAARIAARHNS